MAVEEEFNEEIPDEDSENFVTVGHLVEYIKKRF
jgi:acyl carrier protein